MKTVLRFLSTALFILIIFTRPLSALDYRTGANAASDPYRHGKYYDHMRRITLTGTGSVDVLAVALSQLGYTEGDSASKLHGESAGYGNYTEYNYNMGDFGIGYGGSEYHWCASFVSFCLYQSGCHDYGDFFDCARFHEGDSGYIWREISCQYWVRALRDAGRFYKRSEYTPKPADLIFFSRDGKSASHIGLVLYVKDGRVYTIEGNTNQSAGIEANGGGVYAKSYKLSNSGILGYGTLPYRSSESVFRIDHSGGSPSAGYYISSGVKHLYTDPKASSRANIDLPKHTLFHVSRVASGTGLCSVLECEYNGRTYYIKNNSDRIYQITHEETKEEATTSAPETTRAPIIIMMKPNTVASTAPTPETTRSPETTQKAETTLAPEITSMPQTTCSPPETSSAPQTTRSPETSNIPQTTCTPPETTIFQTSPKGSDTSKEQKEATELKKSSPHPSSVFLVGAMVSAALTLPVINKRKK